jgi:hypothetical protein
MARFLEVLRRERANGRPQLTLAALLSEMLDFAEVARPGKVRGAPSPGAGKDPV